MTGMRDSLTAVKLVMTPTKDKPRSIVRAPSLVVSVDLLNDPGIE